MRLQCIKGCIVVFFFAMEVKKREGEKESERKCQTQAQLYIVPDSWVTLANESHVAMNHNFEFRKWQPDRKSKWEWSKQSK